MPHSLRHAGAGYILDRRLLIPESPVLCFPSMTAEVRYDGGETGCGELLLDLLLFTRRLPPGTIVEVRALDPGAPLEIPAWCRLTGNQLIEAAHPLYLLRTASKS